MKNILFPLPILIMLLFPIGEVMAASMSYPLAGEAIVTSEYGWRTHPIFGTQKYHSGIDFGADYGQEVYAAADGNVELAEWYDGYGYAVILDHGDGIETLYGHNQTLIVFPGQSVSQGEVIAYAGSTGNSTGPHCHFEVMKNSETVDPAPFLDGNFPASGGMSDFFKSDYNVIPLDFDSHFDFAKPLREATETFSNACTTGMGYLKNEVMWLFIMLSTIDLALAAMWRLFSTEGDNTITFLMRKSLAYGFLIFVITHWGDMAANSIRDYFTYMGAMAAGSSIADAGVIVSDPTLIVQKGIYLVAPFFTYIGTFSGMQLLYNMGTVQMVLLMGFMILGCWFLIGFQIAMAYIEFYIIGMFSIVTMSFSGFKHTKQFAGKGLDALIQISLKLMFYCFFAILLTNVMENASADDYFTSEQTQSGSYGANGIDQFMEAIGRQESEGSGGYEAVNEETGAAGKYQIMPENWPVWAAEAGLSPDAPMTPENQDLVARYKMLEYYNEFGDWRAVAVAWNGGEGAVGNGFPEAENYADQVMQKIGQPIDKAFNFLVALKLLLVSLLFVFLGDRVSKIFTKLLSGNGVQL